MINEFYNQFPDYPKDKAVLQEYIWHMHRDRKIYRVSYEEILREAMGKPLFGTAHGSKTTVSRIQEAVLRLLFRWFAVDPLTAVLKDRKAEFNERGFRKASYREAARAIPGLKLSTWRWCISKFKGANIIHAYQDEKRGEIWGAWWLRLNPCRIIQCIDIVTNKRFIQRLTNRPGGKMSDKCLNGWTRFSSSTVADSQSASPPAAAASSVSQRSGSGKKKKKKKAATLSPPSSFHSFEDRSSPADHESIIPATPNAIASMPAQTTDEANPPDGGIDYTFPVVQPPPNPYWPANATDLDSPEPPQGYKPDHPDARMDEVIGILSKAYPEVLQLNESDYRKVFRLVTHPIFKQRLDPDKASDLVRFKQHEDAYRILGWRIMRCKKFVDLIPKWYDVTTRLLMERLADYDLRCFNDWHDFEHRAALILNPKVETQMNIVFTQNSVESSRMDEYGLMPEPEYVFARQLAILLLRGIKTKVTEVLAAKARNYLMQRPTFYVPLWRECPEVKDLCRIPDSIHQELLKIMSNRENEIAVWNRISEHYGTFE